MEKKSLIIMISSLIIFSILLVVLLLNDIKSIYNVFNGNSLAILVDEISVNTIPEKGPYKVDVFCQKGKGKWLYDTWKLQLSDNTENNNCILHFNTLNTNDLFFNNFIASIEGSSGNGAVVNENGFRYEGKNPNNYIWFNNEMWRIIGVFDEETTGLTGTRVKIIRNEDLGGLAFDKNNSNVWNGSSLQILLNDYYYFGRNNNGTNDIGTYCYGFSFSAQGNCDYRKEAKGIKDEYRPMIENSYWKTGGFDYNDSFEAPSAATMYASERSVTGTQHYIGLMYPSDYAYSPLTTSECPKTGAMNEACASQSWLYGKSFEWTISPDSSDIYYAVWAVFFSGYIEYDFSSYGYAARPVLYLKSSVYYIDGDGSYENPYIIGM